MRGRRYSLCVSVVACAVLTCPIATAQSTASPDLSDCSSLTAEAPAVLPDSVDAAGHLIACGKRYRDTSDNQRALRAFTAAVGMATRQGDRPRLAEVVRLQGDMYRLLGDNERADAAFRQSLQVSEEIGDRGAQADALSYLGRLRTQQGKLQEALDYHTRSLALYEAVGDQLGIAIATNNIGVQHRFRGDYAGALPYLQRSLQALNTLGDRRRSATVLVSIAAIHRTLGDYDQSRALLQQALDIRQQLDDREGMASTIEAMAFDDEARGNYAAALDGLTKSLDIRRSLALAYSTAESLNNLGVLYRLQGSYAQAVKHLQDALTAAAHLDNAGLQAEVLTNLGEVYYLQDRTALARQTLQAGLQAAEKGGAPVETASARLELGRLLARTGQLPAASAAFSQSLEFYRTTGDRSGEADALIALAAIDRRQGRPDRGLEQATTARSLAEAMDLPELQWRALTEIGRLNRALHRPGPAAKAFEDAIAIVDTLRDRVGGGEETRSAFLESRLAPYQERIAVALSESHTADAFVFAERSKARALVDAIRSDRFPVSRAMTAEERAREVQLRSALISVNSQVLVAAQASTRDEALLVALQERREAARREYEDFRTTLYAAHPELRVERADHPVVSAADARRLVATGSAAIVEFVATPRMWAFVISADATRAFPLATSARQLAADVNAFRQQLANRDLRADASAQRLYATVLGPLGDALRGKSDLTIVPDGVLWDLPFQALQPRPGRYLIEDAAIDYAPSVTVLRETRRVRHEHAAGPALLAFGNPAFGSAAVARGKMTLMDDRLEPLPEAENQVGRSARCTAATAAST